MPEDKNLSQLNKIIKGNVFSCACLVLFSLISFSLSLAAAPSGGPYGPIRQTYDLPDVNGKIYYVAPDGKAENSGETLEEPTTLEKAIEKVVTGDAIVLRGGTYRTDKQGRL